MNEIYELRNRWDLLYQPVFTKIIGAIMVFFGFQFVMSTGLFAGQLGLIVSIIFALLYCHAPGITTFIFCCAFFVCTVHIKAIFALFIACVAVLFCGMNYLQIALAIFTPFAMSLTGGFDQFYWCIFILFIYISAKCGKTFASVAYSIYFSLLLLMKGKFGLMHVLYKKSVNWRTTKSDSFEELFGNVNLSRAFERFVENQAVDTIMIMGVILITGVALHLIFSNDRIFAKVQMGDLRELVGFVLGAVALIVMNITLAQILGYPCGVHYVGMIIQIISAYILSRPFASKAVQQTFLTKRQMEEAPLDVQSMRSVVAKDNWDDIAGYENTKQDIKEAICPYVDKEEYKKLQNANMKPIKGILLFGPPGTGKTSIARAIANETKMKLIVVNAGEFLNKYVGESEKNLRNIFQDAKKNAPSLICFDEIESFLAKRTDESRSYEKNIITTFLSQMDGFNDLKDVLVVGTTNKPDLIDPAALRPGRFDKIIYVGAPDESARKALFRKYLHKKANLDLIDIDRLVDLSERYTGADIKGVCEEAYRKNNFMPLMEGDIVDHLKSIRPSYTLDMRDEYERWSIKYNRSSIAEKDYKQKKKNSLHWEDIKGMDDLKDILKKKIENPIKNMEKYRQYRIPVSKGILFFGPPGCGKTFFAKVVADECDTAFFTINGPELLGGNVGESERNLREVFREAREAKPAIIFFDEIDAIAQKRESAADSVRIINQLLTEMDGMESLDGVIVIAATNRPDILDSALLRAGRFDTKIYIGMPDVLAKKDMLASALSDIPNTLDFIACAQEMDDYSCADITGVANKIKEFFIQRSIIDGEDMPVSMADFAEIIRTVKPSISKDELQRYEAMKELQSIL